MVSQVQVSVFVANHIRILIILDLDVLEELGECEKIGEPKALEIKPEEDSKGQPGTIQGNDFYGNKGQAQPNNQQQRSIPSRTKTPSSSAHANIYPIEALSPYSHKWTIKARCTNKSDIKTWHNRNGEGKLFSVNLLDESGEVRATGFNDQCDLLYELFQENSVYYISSPCRVQIAKKQFSNLNNDYELTFERDTQVEKAEEQDGVPQVRFNFTGIADLQDVQKDTTVDVVGILKEVGETSQITSKTTSKPYDKRELTLVDQTGFSVRLTVWGKTAAAFEVSPDAVVAFKGVKVSDFGGRSLSLLSSGSMTVDPDIDEAHRLRGWYDAQGRTDAFESHANLQGAGVGAAGGQRNDYKTISQIKEEQLGMGEEADFFSVRASIMFIKQESFAYPACTTEKCNKKVIEANPGEWHCERCNITHPKPEYRYVLSINVSDHTGQIWLSAFNETGVLIMGKSADELMSLKEDDDSSDSKKLGEVFQEASHRIWNFRCKAKLDNFQEQQRHVFVHSCFVG